MLVFNKTEIRDALTLENVFTLLQEFGGDPEYTIFGIISATICHNEPGAGSKKLYYYANTSLFQCYSNCGSFDIFDLVRKVVSIQKHLNYDLNDAVRWVAQKFGFTGRIEEAPEEGREDWDIFAAYERLQLVEVKENQIVLPEYDANILSNFNYNVIIGPWLDEGIGLEAMRQAKIGYYAGGDQITIPHFDQNNRFIGLRGRTLSKEDGERYGKYRPIRVNNQMYNHPLGFNLYNLNNSKNNIQQLGKVFVFESEKSTLLYQTYFGLESDISVACCGSNLTSYQVQLLLAAGAQEIIVAFDKQYEALNTPESKKWAEKLTKIYKNYKNEVTVSFLWDKEDLLNYKSSPIDEGKDKFLHLYNQRILL